MIRIYLFIAVFLYALIAEAQWGNAVLDSLTKNNQRDEVVRQSIAVDDLNNLHVVYIRAKAAGGWVVYYRTRPAGQPWTPEVMVSDTNFAAFEPALAVDKATGTAYIAYTLDNGTAQEIYLANNGSGSWTSVNVSNNTDDDGAPTIAVDGNGKVHLAWIGLDNIGLYRIFYAENISGNWNVQILTNSALGQFGSGAYPYIATTQAGTAHILYRGGGFSNYNIDHAYNNGPGDTTWLYENIITPNQEDFTGVITIGPDSVLNVAISGSGGFGFPVDVYYLYQLPGQQWSFPEQVNSGFNGEVYSIFLDTAGFVHIAMNGISGNFYTGDVYYASDLQGGGGWLVTPLLTTGDIFNASIILDNNNDGYALAFRGTSTNDLEVVIYGEPAITSVYELDKNNTILIYPNPFENYLNLVLKNHKVKDISSVNIRDLSGKLIDSKIIFSEQDKLKIITDEFPSGIYFVQVLIDDEIFNYKVVKK